jgi:hypothetical protein
MFLSAKLVASLPAGFRKLNIHRRGYSGGSFQFPKNDEEQRRQGPVR